MALGSDRADNLAGEDTTLPLTDKVGSNPKGTLLVVGSKLGKPTEGADRMRTLRQREGLQTSTQLVAAIRRCLPVHCC